MTREGRVVPAAASTQRRVLPPTVTRMPPENADRILDSRMGPGTYFTTPVQALRYTVGKVTALPSSTSKNRRKILRSRDMARLYNVRVMSGFTGTMSTYLPKSRDLNIFLRELDVREGNAITLLQL